MEIENEFYEMELKDETLRVFKCGKIERLSNNENWLLVDFLNTKLIYHKIKVYIIKLILSIDDAKAFIMSTYSYNGILVVESEDRDTFNILVIELEEMRMELTDVTSNFHHLLI